MITRRAIPRDSLFPTMHHARASEPLCRATIKLDGRTYGCGREVRTTDRQHDGIHDAFADHSDNGAVRW